MDKEKENKKDDRNENDSQRLLRLEGKVDKIMDFLAGSELHIGASHKIEKNSRNITKLWVTVYGILIGFISVLAFLIIYAEKIFKFLQ